ncbi:MAG: ribosomal protein S18-alanine N-acetyltransferase [Persicimonas sp.]
MTIRSAVRADLSEVALLERAARSTPWTESRFARELELDVSRVWVAEACDRKPANLAGLLVFWMVGDEVQIHDVAVAPERRREGIATALLGRLIDHAHSHNARQITLEVREENTGAIALYESLEFEIMGRREAYYPDTGEAALLMTRHL